MGGCVIVRIDAPWPHFHRIDLVRNFAFWAAPLAHVVTIQMFQNTDDIRIRSLRPLISPAILLEELPVTAAASQTVASHREAATDIIFGRDDRLLVVVGPCSIHDIGAAHEYADLLQGVVEKYKGELELVMRVYFEKPRTTVGWKGMINDPDIDNSFNINKGLRMARKLLLDLADRGIPAGTEFLDTITPQYVADLTVWGAIGARTTESQIHRELASGLSVPVGFKNGTGGSIRIAVDAIRAAAHSHHFLSVTKFGTSAVVETTGNEACHLILRGSTRGTNYDAQSVADAAQELQAAGAPHRVMIDCSHGNSNKDHNRQINVAQDVAQQMANGSELIMGVMIESHIKAGRQDWAGEATTYGQSITDACVSWEQTLEILDVLAEGVRARRASRAAQ